MRLKIERHGGLAGLPAVGECDGADLSPAQRRALEHLLASPPAPGPSAGSDRFRYKLQITDENGTRVIDVPEHAMPEELASIAELRL